MERVFKDIHEFSSAAEICYNAQNKAFSSLELPLLNQLLRPQHVKEILDVGSGDGSYLTQLAEWFPGKLFMGVEVDPNLVKSAKDKYDGANIKFINEEFNQEFDTKEYDLVLARFSAEHSGDAQRFIANIFRRVQLGGTAMITEWWAGGLPTSNPVWKLFQENEVAIYNKFGSFPDLPLKVPQMLKKAGFMTVNSTMLHVSPSTIGAATFYDLVIAYANLYATFDAQIWSPEVTKRIFSYAEEAKTNPPDQEDVFVVSQSVAHKMTPRAW